MAVKRAKSSMSVVEAAQKRVLNVFSNGVPVYMSFSGGKDSICMADIVYKLIQRRKIDASQLTVIFVDEEAIYDCVIDMTMQWRRKFIMAGAQFRWYCLPLKQVSCFNQLTNDESWITWEPGKEHAWVRKPPSFAIRSSPYLEGVGKVNYQTFLPRVTKDGIMLTGVRAAESVQRLQYMSTLNLGRQGITGTNTIYPIYDWKDNDIWMYIRDHQLDIPEAYLWLYQSGVSRPALRISNFFGIDSLAGLKHVAETDPDLWARIERREPNAYMTLLYWDSEWYKRSTRKRTKSEGEDKRDFKELCRKMLFEDAEKHFTNPTTQRVCKQYRRCFTKIDGMARPRDYRQMHDALVAGDPKLRTLRAIYQNVYGAYAEYAKKFRVQEGGECNG
ncbi:MAG: phosphoadenosine phosphosulfate reductase family protein [Clostridia bacterium]|nr:phosphoadenosine phosphosulfate reductase family protein [Clostridia bacterium]